MIGNGNIAERAVKVDPTAATRYTLNLIGAFRLAAPDGRRIDIVSKKGMALIATLAMAKDGERTRSWLYDKLWGSRAELQARSSLRRELSNLRKFLNTQALELLVCTHDRVRLDLRHLSVDARGEDAAVGEGEFLEGLDLSGEDGFEDWLREQRTRLKDASAQHRTRNATAGQRPGPAHTDAAHKAHIGIAVLPFANLSDDPEQDYFSTGVTEDIITDLSKVSALSVVSRNTTLAFRDKPVDIRQIMQTLHVTYILEGSVRKVGDRVRITAQLIDGASDSPIWAERYDRSIKDIFSVQDEISRAITSALRLTLLPEEKRAIEVRATTNSEAYRLFLMARQYNATGNERHQEVVERLCRRALELDPGYGPAWAMLSNCQIELFRRNVIADDGWNAAQRALELSPDLAESHAAQGAVLCIRGRYAEGLKICERAIGLDANSYEANKHAGRCCLAMHRFPDAVGYFERAAAVMPGDYYALGMVQQAYQGMGDVAGMKNAARRNLDRLEGIIAKEPDHGRAIGLGVYALATLGDAVRAKEWAARAMLLDPENTNMKYNIACAMIRLGDHDFGLDILAELGGIMNEGLVKWMESDTDFNPVRDHPRFRAVVAQANQRLSAA